MFDFAYDAIDALDVDGDWMKPENFEFDYLSY